MRYAAVRGVPSVALLTDTRVASWLKPFGPVTRTSALSIVETLTAVSSAYVTVNDFVVAPPPLVMLEADSVAVGAALTLPRVSTTGLPTVSASESEFFRSPSSPQMAEYWAPALGRGRYLISVRVPERSEPTTNFTFPTLKAIEFPDTVPSV